MSRKNGAQPLELRSRIKELRYVDTADITPHPGNWRGHPKNQADALAGVLREVGIADALLCYESPRNGGKLTLIDGHLRKDAAPGQWPVLVLDVDDAEADYLLATFDPLTSMAIADKAALDALLATVESSEAAVQQMLTDVAQAAGLYIEDADNGEDPGAQVDKADELQAKWNVKPGDVWALENHRLICGDCRDSARWERLLQGVKVNGVFTSPPYAEQRKEQYGGVPAAEYVEWWEAVQANVKANLAQDGSFFVNIKAHSDEGQRSLYTLDLVCAMARRFGWQYRDDFVWTHSGTPGDAEMMHKFKNQHEPIYWFTLADGFKFRPLDVRHESDGAVIVSPKNPGLERIQGKKGGALVGATVGHGLAFPGNVLSVGKNNGDDTGGHVAVFPIGLPDFFIRAYSDTGDVWLDPFCGSGTTLIAAEQNGRRGMGIEMLEKYCAVILERFFVMTGKTPTLVSDG